jgi:hypothetical protein
MDDRAPLETQHPMQRLGRFLLPAILLALLVAASVGAYTWYARYGPCNVDAVEDSSALLLSQMKLYDKEYQFAATAPRESIMHPMAVLERIFMDTRDAAVPACMQTAKEELVNYMGTVIRAFQAFGAEEAESTIRDMINQSERHYGNFNRELEAVKECAPFCRP